MILAGGNHLSDGKKNESEAEVPRCPLVPIIQKTAFFSREGTTS